MTPPTVPLVEHLITVEDVSIWLAERGHTMRPDAVRAAMRTQRLPGRKVSGQWLTTVAALEHWFGITTPSVPIAPALVSPFLIRRSAA